MSKEESGEDDNSIGGFNRLWITDPFVNSVESYRLSACKCKYIRYLVL